MSKKPEPRRSALSSAHPYAPATVDPAPQAPPVEADTPVAEPASVAAPAPAPVARPRATAPAPKATPTDNHEKRPMSVRATKDDQARIRAAYLATNSAERHGSLSDFVVRATLEKVAALEATYNDGERWTPADPGSVPTGRPLSG